MTDKRNETLASGGETTNKRGETTSARHALLVVEDGKGPDALREKLAAAGFEVESASADEAQRRVEERAPDVVFIAFGERESEGRLVALARRLRAEPETFALPVVLLFRADERTLRSAAQHMGADDYFSRDSSREELRARTQSLLWRVEAGRRSAPAAADQRSEIDNFLFLLDAVGADSRRGATGAVALIETEGGPAVAQRRANTLTAAHGFLKLNLRRVDAVAFYGPATLLVYLPGADSHAARSTFSRLREELLRARPGGDLFIGISSFPGHASDVESLVEQAESALREARGENSASRVIVYGVEGAARDEASGEWRRTTQGEGRAKATEDRRSARESEADEAATKRAPGAFVQAGESAGASAERAAAEAQAVVRRAGGKTRRLMLVVSDAARMAQVNLLLRSEGYEVRAAFDGQHALNLLRIDRPEVLVVDYQLNGMDGAEMLRRLTKQTGTGHAPRSLLLVPGGREELRREAMEAGAHAIVELPYDPVELLDRLHDFGDAG